MTNWTQVFNWTDVHYPRSFFRYIQNLNLHLTRQSTLNYSRNWENFIAFVRKVWKPIEKQIYEFIVHDKKLRNSSPYQLTTVYALFKPVLVNSSYSGGKVILKLRRLEWDYCSVKISQKRRIYKGLGVVGASLLYSLWY